MQIQRSLLFSGMLFSCGVALAQPDYQRNAPSLRRAQADPAIARALASITPAQIDQTVKTLVSFGTRNTLTSMEQSLPAGQGINAAADWIANQFETISRRCGDCLEVKRDTFVADPASGASWGRRIPKPTRITNVYAVMRGTDPERSKRMVLVTGHYDSINSNVFANWADTSGAAPGANDDASGVAVSLACARALSKLKFPSTIVFVAVAGEEQGLVGSEHLAKLAKSEGWQLEAVLNNDIVGGNTTPGDALQMKDRVRVFSEGVPSNETPAEATTRRSVGGENDSASRQLARFIKEVSERSVPQMKVMMVYRRDRYGRGGDHIPFLERGYPAVRFTEVNEEFRHQHQNVRVENGVQYGDLPEFVDFPYVANVARVNAASLAALALAPARPQGVTIQSRLSNDTDLKWEPNKEPDLAGYEIVWRDTTAAVWTNSKPVGNVTAFSMKGMSKDNFFYGVRAIDREGNRSPVTYPKPQARTQPASPSSQ